MTTPLTDAEIQAAEAACKAASDGPWWSDAINVESSHVIIAQCGSGLADRDLAEVTANADFIALSRDLIPRALEDIKFLKIRVKNLSEHWPDEMYGVRMFANASVACKAAVEENDKLRAERAALLEVVKSFASVALETTVHDELRCYIMGCDAIDALDHPLVQAALK